ncbi:MAG: GAF domain-containing sensor histidine kinase [Acidobacteriota bacterium]
MSTVPEGPFSQVEVSDGQHRHALEDTDRLDELDATALLDSASEEVFDRVTRLAAAVTGLPISLVSLVTSDRQFFKSCFGLPEPLATERQTPLTHSYCQYVVSGRKPLVVADARLDPLLKDNLATTEIGVVSYLGVPLTTSRGHVLGTLCVVDVEPREFSERDISLLTDLAATVTTEVELRLLARQLQDSHLALRQRELQREELTQLLVHDLRNPLTSILGGLELVEHIETDSRARHYVSLAHAGARSMLQMVESLLELSRAEAGHLQLDREWLEPARLLEATKNHVAALAESQGVHLAFNAESDRPFHADRGHLRRMLVNLVSNGIQHTPTNGHVRVRILDRDDDRVRFEVEDTGSGIPEDAFEIIFDKFRQAHAARTRTTGSGLGLPLCKLVVEAHGGTIELESTLGQGTLFIVELPRQAAD